MDNHSHIPQKVDYVSEVDGKSDWYMRCDAVKGGDCVVVLHGHGSKGDQLFTRPDQTPIREFLERIGANVISPNLRDNAWMNPAAVSDLTRILEMERSRMQFRRCFLASASMGGTGSLIFAMRHPEMVDGLVILGAATSIRRYRKWCATGDLPIHQEIRKAINANYTDEAMTANDVCDHAASLTMPLYFFHSQADRVIPISEMRELQRRMAGMSNAHFTELPPLQDAPNWWSDHDAPIQYFIPAMQEVMGR